MLSHAVFNDSMWLFWFCLVCLWVLLGSDQLTTVILVFMLSDEADKTIVVHKCSRDKRVSRSTRFGI